MHDLLTRHRLSLFVTTVIVTGFVALIVELAVVPLDELFGPHPEIFATFALLLVVTELRPMPALTGTDAVTASWTFAVGLLLIAPPAAGVLVATGVALLTEISVRRELQRTLFNGAQFCLSLTLGALAGSAFADPMQVVDGGIVDLRWLAAALTIAVVAFLVNSTLVGAAIAIHRGMPVTEIVGRSLRSNLMMDGLLLALTPVFVVISVHGFILLPLLLISVLVIISDASLAFRNHFEATHDQLTGIPNRRHLEDQVALMLDGATSADRPVALLHLDLDGFKDVNDQLGHRYGDLVLVEIARRIMELCPSPDQVARLGGDEFVVLLSSVSGAEEARVVGEHVTAAIRAPMSIDGVPLSVGASIGIALFPEHGRDLVELLASADEAMYRAKTNGTGIETFAGSTKSLSPGRIALLADLHQAIDRDELHLVYQPKAHIETGMITGVEALVRWTHPIHGLVEPDWFMPHAEQTEMMTVVTDHVLDLAVAQCASWLDRGIALRVAVNASARNLHDLRFPERVARILATHRVDPHLLEIEITENTVMSDPVRTASVLGHLRGIGVSLAIDDFGTGFSSLASLQTLTIDRIKIDKSFVAGMAERSDDLVIVRSVIDLAHNLGLVTVAEGVEDARVLELLDQLGCDEYQGYLLSRPAIADELEPLLRRHRQPAAQPAVDLSEAP